jgi:hypothetical protein
MNYNDCNEMKVVFPSNLAFVPPTSPPHTQARLSKQHCHSKILLRHRLKSPMLSRNHLIQPRITIQRHEDA